MACTRRPRDVDYQSLSFPHIQPILTLNKLRGTDDIAADSLGDLCFGFCSELARPDHDGLTLAAR
jgi:hypothetical protein